MKLLHTTFAFVLVSSSASIAAAQDLTPPPPMNQPQPQEQQQQQQQLAPPPPMQQPAPPPPQSTEQRLDDSKKEDSGRGLEFLYVNAQAGGVYDALGTFSNTLQLQNTNAGGAMVGAEAGVRFVWFTLGARFRYDMLQPFNIWQLNAVVGFHIPAGKWDPYVSVHGGYSAIGSIDPNNLQNNSVTPALPCTGTGCTTQDAANTLSTKGGNVGFAFGVDYYPVRFFSIGIDGTFEAIFLHRDPLALPAACEAIAACVSTADANPYYSQSGDAAGVSVVGSVHIGLHL